MLNTNERIIKHKVGLLNLAEWCQLAAQGSSTGGSVCPIQFV